MSRGLATATAARERWIPAPRPGGRTSPDSASLLKTYTTHGATRTTIVFATHDPFEALLLADRVIVPSLGPAGVGADFRVDVPRPRRFDDPLLETHARDLSAGVHTRAA
jgi:ABC-type nitrate/sulfonate/bicarbonate transport system ATPase subunit